jgi:transposase-like protein
MRYTNGFKERMVQRLAGPERATALQLSAETGVSQPTLSRWLRDASKVVSRKKKTSAKGAKRSGEDMFRIVARAAQLSDEELGTFLRKEGVHEATLAQWQEAATSGLADVSKPKTRKASPDAEKVKKLEKELLRKDKALAELSALMVLQKKVQAIWGDEGESTPRKKRS